MDNPIVLGLGVLMVLYGLYMANVRRKNPEKLSKLKRIQRLWGEHALTVHMIAYTIIPICVGAALIFTGITGKWLF
jgi:hypothetical protein